MGLERGEGRFPGLVVLVGNTGNNTRERSSFLFVSFWEVKRVLIIIQLEIFIIWLTVAILRWELVNVISQRDGKGI